MNWYLELIKAVLTVTAYLTAKEVQWEAHTNGIHSSYHVFYHPEATGLIQS
jgi:hypothetical protein